MNYVTKPGANTSVYASAADDDHPNAAGSRKATQEFVPMLNVFYHRWQASQGAANPPIAQNATAQAGQPPAEEATPMEAAQSSAGQPSSGSISSVLDDFEGQNPPGTEGWQTYFDEASSQTQCQRVEGDAAAGKAALRMDFTINKMEGWGSCELSFNQPQDWRSWKGLGLTMRVDKTGLPLAVLIHAGPAQQQGSYAYELTSDASLVQTWKKLEIPWENFKRVEWEENPGSSLMANEINGVAIVSNGLEGEKIQGSVFIDEMIFLGGEQNVPQAVQPQPVEPQQNQPQIQNPPTESISTPRPTPYPTPIPKKERGLVGRICPLSAALPLGFALLVALRRRRLPG